MLLSTLYTLKNDNSNNYHHHDATATADEDDNDDIQHGLIFLLHYGDNIKISEETEGTENSKARSMM